MTPETTVSISWVRTVLAEAHRQGVSGSSLMAAAGIDEAALDAARWPIDDVTRIWRAATRLTRDPGFGLKAGALVGPASLDVVGPVILSAGSLRQAITALQKYQSLVSDGVRLQLLAVGEASWMIYHPQQGELAFCPQQVEAVLAAVAGSARWVTRRPLRPLRARFGHAPQGPLHGYREAFGCEIEFDAAFSGLLIDNEALDRPIPQADPRLARLFESLATERLRQQTRGRRIDEVVQAWLARHLEPPLPTREQAAQALGLGPRTLARRLQALGTSYAQLLDDARRDAALREVAAGDRPLKDIALGLGFSGPSPFNRAFVRWCGMTPGQWRRRARAARDGEPAAGA